jgi:ketosteroid isomerase-like protein
MLFEKMVKAQDEGDVNSWRECLHDDWEFLMHSTGKVHRKGSADPEEWAKLIKSIKREKQRCIYENDEILVTHSFNTYASGDKEALLWVSRKKDGLLWRTETGATQIKKC